VWLRIALIGGFVLAAALVLTFKDYNYRGQFREPPTSGSSSSQSTPAVPVGPPPPQSGAPADARSEFDRATKEATASALNNYLQKFPYSEFSELARKQLSELQRAPASTTGVGTGADAAEKMAALRKAIEALPKGNIVLAAPSKMTVGDKREVKASVGVDVPIEKLRKQSSPSDQQKEGSLYLSPEMVATLSGPASQLNRPPRKNSLSQRGSRPYGVGTLPRKRKANRR